MAYNQEYPGVDVQMYNADWLLAEMHEVKAEWSTVKEEWKKFQTDLTQAWEEYKNSQEQSWEEFKDRVNTIMANFQIAIRHEWQTYKTELTHDWELFQQTIHTTNSEFQQYVNQQLSQYEINYKADMNNFNQAWQAYQTNINNIVNSVKDLPDDWETYKQQVNKEIADQNTYINNYFKNLDITANLEVALQNKIDDGTLTETIQTAFNNAINQKSHPKIALIGDEPSVSIETTIGADLEAQLRRTYPNTIVKEHLYGFYENNQAWESLKGLKQQYGSDFTHVLVLVTHKPDGYTSSNCHNLTAAIQKELPTAKVVYMLCLAKKTVAIANSLGVYWRILEVNSDTGIFFNAIGILNAYNEYNSNGTPNSNWLSHMTSIASKALVDGFTHESGIISGTVTVVNALSFSATAVKNVINFSLMPTGIYVSNVINFSYEGNVTIQRNDSIVKQNNFNAWFMDFYIATDMYVVYTNGTNETVPVLLWFNTVGSTFYVTIVEMYKALYDVHSIYIVLNNFRPILMNI